MYTEESEDPSQSNPNNQPNPGSTPESSSATPDTSGTPSDKEIGEVTMAEVLSSARSIANIAEVVYNDCKDCTDLCDDSKSRLRRRWLVRQKTYEVLRRALNGESEDICGLCGEEGADKVPHPVYWPGEKVPGTPYVHRGCEESECDRAMFALSEEERAAFLAGLQK